MANFKVRVETDPRNGNFVVRYTDGSRLPNGRLKQFTDCRIEKTQRMTIKGEVKTGKWLANAIADELTQKFLLKKSGNFDTGQEIAPLVEEWLQNCQTNNLSWTTIAHYGYSLQAFLKETSHRILGELTLENIKAWRSTMIQAKRAHWTVRGRLADLRSFLSYLKEEGKIELSPYGQGKKIIPLQKDAEPRFYTTAEFMELDKAAIHFSDVCPSLRPAIHLAHSQGLRKCEILGDGRDRKGVTWEDITWRPDGKADLLLRKEITKGQKKSRTLRLDPGTLAVLGSRKSGPIIAMERWQFDYYFGRARLWARIDPNLDIHGLRHTFAKNYLQRGQGNLASLKELLGHSSIQTTQIYAQFEKSYLAEGIERAYEARLQEEALLNQDKSQHPFCLPIALQENNAGQLRDINAKKFGPDGTPLDLMGLKALTRNATKNGRIQQS